MREAPLPGRPAAAVPRGTALPLAMYRHPRAHRGAARDADKQRAARALRGGCGRRHHPPGPALPASFPEWPAARSARSAGSAARNGRRPRPPRAVPITRPEPSPRGVALTPRRPHSHLRRLARLRPHAAPLRRLKGCRLRRVPSSHRRPHVGAASGAGPLPEMASGGGLPTIVAAAIGNY